MFKRILLIVVKKAVLVFLFILIYFHLRYILFLLFPGLVFVLLFKKTRGLFESTLFTIFTSLSFWIVTFWILKYLPISFSRYATFIVLLSFFRLIICECKLGKFFAIKKEDVLSFLIIAMVFIPFIPIMSSQVAPSGGDMATHTYIARLIYEKNAFPQTYEPIAPAATFGLSPFGTSVLMALLALATKLSFNLVALYISLFSYVLLFSSLFLFLRRKFSLFVSFVSIFLISWGSQHIIQYFFWGGNANILSFSFITYACIFFLKIYQEKLQNIVNGLLLSIFIYASFTVHQIPTVSGFVVLIPILILNFKNIKNEVVNNKKFYIATILFLTVMSIPFLSILKIPSPSTFEWVREWQYKEYFHTYWNSDIQERFFSLAIYLREKWGLLPFFTILVGIGISLEENDPENSVYISILLSVFFLLINSEYWLLPLSALLYPDRVITFVIFPAVYYMAKVIKKLLEINQKYYKVHNNKIFIKITFLTLCYLLSLFVVNDLLGNLKFIYQSSLNNLAVRQDDLEAFKWISANTTLSDVFANNSGDSGIWIPGLAYRKVVNYDYMPWDLDTMKTERYKPNYVFIGSHPVYKKDIYINYNKVKDSPIFKLVFQSGDAYVFKLKKDMFLN